MGWDKFFEVHQGNRDIKVAAPEIPIDRGIYSKLRVGAQIEPGKKHLRSIARFLVLKDDPALLDLFRICCKTPRMANELLEEARKSLAGRPNVTRPTPLEPDKIRASDNSVLLSLHRPSSSYAYHFTQPDMEMVGRKAEKIRLEAFLEDAEPFQWWFITGHGGEGKSRLALWLHDFALSGKDEETGTTTTPFTHVGFADSVKKDANWADTVLHGDALIIVDYLFFQEIQQWHNLISFLSKHPLTNKVRLLFVERSAGGVTAEALVQQARQEDFYQKAYDKGDPLELGPVAEPWEIIREVYSAKHGTYPPDDDKDRVIGGLKRVDGGKTRALFCHFAAEAYAEGKDPTSWTLNELLNEPLVRFVHRECRIGGVDEEHLNLLFFATLLGSVNRTRSAIPGVLPSRWDSKQCQRIANFHCDFIASKDAVIRKLEPDPLGEAFVLERLLGNRLSGPGMDYDDRIEADSEALLVAAWNADQHAVLDFIRRAIVDFPHHGAWQQFGSLPIEELDLSGSSLTSLEPLRPFSQLKTLDLVGLEVQDLSPLAGLTALQNLSLYGTRVEDLGPLAGLSALQKLDLHETMVEDLGPLSLLTGLQELGLGRTEVRDLRPLSGLTSLRILALDSTRVEILTPLSDLLSMQSLVLNDTPVRDIGALSSLTSLTNLGLSGTKVKSLTPLARLTSLLVLLLADTQVQDLQPLSSLTALQALMLPRTQVDELGPVSNMLALQALWLNGTKVQDLRPLHKLTDLQMLSLSGTPVSGEDVATLRQELPNCTIYD